MAEWVKIMIQLYAAYKSVTDRLKVKPRKKKMEKDMPHTLHKESQCGYINLTQKRR